MGEKLCQGTKYCYLFHISLPWEITFSSKRVRNFVNCLPNSLKMFAQRETSGGSFAKCHWNLEYIRAIFFKL